MSTQSGPLVCPAQAASVSRDPLEQTATPVTSERRLAGVAERGGALLLDGLVLLAVAATFAVLFGVGTLDSVSTTNVDRVGVHMTVGDVFARPLLVSWFIYLVATEALFGATLGKRFTGYRTIQMDGSPLTVRSVVRRGASGGARRPRSTFNKAGTPSPRYGSVATGAVRAGA